LYLSTPNKISTRPNQRLYFNTAEAIAANDKQYATCSLTDRKISCVDLPNTTLQMSRNGNVSLDKDPVAVTGGYGPYTFTAVDSNGVPVISCT
jgi:hypothetical protein